MLVQTQEQMDAAFTVLIDADVIVVDTETFYIAPGVPTKQLGIVTYCPIKGRDVDVSFYFPFRHEHSPTLFPSENLPMEYLRKLKVAFEREGITLVFHNAKFDLAVLARDGIHPDSAKVKMYDTMLMSHMSDENGSHALKRLGKDIYGVDADVEEKQIKQLAKTLSPDTPPKIASGWHLIPPEAMALYAEKDVLLTYKLWEHFMEDLKEQELDKLWDREEQFCYFLMSMESHGVLVNVEKAKELAAYCEARRGEIQDELGFDPMKPDQLAKVLFSPAPVGLGFLPLGFGKPSKSHPDGRPVMDKHALAHYEHSIVERVLEYRGLVKAESTWFQGFIDHLWPDGRVHSDYRQHGTVTTRLSCGSPNMQQLPRVDEDDTESKIIKHQVKSILSAPEGFELWEADYSQLEPRLAACYSEDPALMDIYRNARDIYQETADNLEITRYQAKQLFLAIMYGAGKAKTAEMLGVPISEAMTILSEFWELYPRLQKTVADASAVAASKGYVRLWTGRRRHFKWPSEQFKAFNSILQGGGAEIVKESGLRLRKELPELRITTQVHDSYWFELKSASLDFALSEIKRVMEWPGEDFRVPFPVECKRIA